MAILANLYRQNEESLVTKHVLNENRMIKSSHPLLDGGTAEVAFDCFCVPLAAIRGHRSSLTGRGQILRTWRGDDPCSRRYFHESYLCVCIEVKDIHIKCSLLQEVLPCDVRRICPPPVVSGDFSQCHPQTRDVTNIVASIHLSVRLSACTQTSHYQSKVFVCVSVISGHNYADNGADAVDRLLVIVERYSTL